MEGTDREASIALAWSGGKDSSLALGALREQGRGPDLLFTTFAEGEKVTVHGVGRELIEAQAEALGLPLVGMTIPRDCSDAEYARLMAEALATPPLDGAGAIAFGDLFLADVRAFREERLREVGRRAEFPLWGETTGPLARRFIDDGYRAVVVSVSLEHLDESFLGREFDESLLADLPREADPCGERGEFHTFVFAGPHLNEPVRIASGAVTSDGRHAWLELLPG